MKKRDQTASRDQARGERVRGWKEVDSWWASGLVFRAACALLGIGTGTLLALLLVFGGAVVGGTSVAIETLLAAGAISGAVCGALAPHILMAAITGLAHFLVGLLSALGSGEFPSPSHDGGWLRACAIFGALYVLGLSVGWGLLR